MTYGFWVIASLFRRSLDTKRPGYFSLIALYYGKIYPQNTDSETFDLWQEIRPKGQTPKKSTALIKGFDPDIHYDGANSIYFKLLYLLSLRL